MKAIGFQMAVGLAILMWTAAANADAVRSPGNQYPVEEFSSRHRCACQWQRPHRVHKHAHRGKLLFSRYPNAPWYSRDYRPRFVDYYPRPVVIVYRQ